MTCRHCGASISGLETRCPYCDSFIEREKKWDDFPMEEEYAPRNTFGSNLNPENDKINPAFLILSFFPLIGIILGASMLSAGMKKSGMVYLFIGIGMIVLPFILPLVYMLLAAIFVR